MVFLYFRTTAEYSISISYVNLQLLFNFLPCVNRHLSLFLFAYAGQMLPVLAHRGLGHLWRLHSRTEGRHSVWHLQSTRLGTHLYPGKQTLHYHTICEWEQRHITFACQDRSWNKNPTEYIKLFWLQEVKWWVGSDYQVGASHLIYFIKFDPHHLSEAQ